MAETAEQSKAISTALEAAANCRTRAKKCAQIGLTVLAREYDHFARAMEERVEWQRRALNPMPRWIDAVSAGEMNGSDDSHDAGSVSTPVSGR